MSHFTVTVCLSAKKIEDLGIEDALNETLAPFDENADVEPYKDYEDGSPRDHWWINALRRDLDGWARVQELGEDVVRAELVEKFARNYDERWSVERDRPENRADRELADFAEAAQHAERITDDIGWATVAELYNAKFHPATALAIPGQVDPDEVDYERLHVDEDGRAYTWSRRNPESKWDWWVIGGRWQRDLISVPGAAANELVFGRPGTFGDNKSPRDTDSGGLCCDGGPIELLDFEAMRDRDAVKALKRYDRYWALVAEHGTAKPWSHFTGLVDVKELTIEDARTQYHDQPLIRAVQALENTDDGLVGWGDCAVELFGTTREEFERIARAGAVPGWALITTEGEWVAPGRMGWFGMSSDGPGERDAYSIAASKYLDSLPPSTVVVQIDCHI